MHFTNEYTYEIKKSKFIAYTYDVSSENEVKEILELLRKEHKKAKHFAYAYIIDNKVKKSDDKEPANTAGMPIYDVLTKKEKNHILLVVIRYFGGIKLGAGGLTRAYRHAAAEVLLEEK